MTMADKFCELLILMLLISLHLTCGREIPTLTNNPPTVLIIGPCLSSESGDVIFQWQGTDSDGQVVKYKYKLDTPKEPDGQWSQWSPDMMKSYSNLVNGGFVFNVQAKDNDGDTSEIEIKPFIMRSNVPPDKALLLDNFDSCSLGDRNLLGGRRGVWTEYPGDSESGITEWINSDVKYGGRCALEIMYDVDSPRQAIVGYYFNLNDDSVKIQDLTPYTKIVFFIKGDQEKGFTTRFQIELRRLEQTKEGERFTITGITKLWQQFTVLFEHFRSFDDFNPITDWSTIAELWLIFADDCVDQDKKSGKIYIDDIYFE